MSSKGSKVKGLKGLMSGRLQRSCVSCDSAPGLGRRGAGRPGGRPRGGGGREGVYSRDTGRGNSREGGAWTASQRGRWKRVSRHTTRSNAPARPPARHAPARPPARHAPAPADVQPAGRVGGRGRRRSPLSPLSGWARKEGALGRLRGSPLSPLRGWAPGSGSRTRSCSTNEKFPRAANSRWFAATTSRTTSAPTYRTESIPSTKRCQFMSPHPASKTDATPCSLPPPPRAHPRSRGARRSRARGRRRAGRA